ncbi:hypothetical protein COS66_00350 [Candidatus Berkelbacteria bacterium CG06_land_8_20_14_3_00_43_10]|uniref:Uncharacterized protein n=1 Tax=Candidatus Berkelbacteria bacterium CG10_big_fil_rev_8_21_14_0_10_43_14 TaxID=1974515 RepID=A0A2M6R856_9BACT|nr:MAG: hypothetical protein AUK41_00235 [Candidatus Berkelbacteria bacterium CG2_30_43_20]PIS06742.1 MAG: hypothetical protein COT79_03080 [Candidatus Berkelbacteria bacterium CG10_big_fil_rev_8_21_14_0_10_43_14]PIU87541.1 MAG: hypothetical protein COS66_00350 [Candidatus Berkelbacteria bacterium CG06_land_8_20_14_3_00_43_10]
MFFRVALLIAGFGDGVPVILNLEPYNTPTCPTMPVMAGGRGVLKKVKNDAIPDLRGQGKEVKGLGRSGMTFTL